MTCGDNVDNGCRFMQCCRMTDSDHDEHAGHSHGSGHKHGVRSQGRSALIGAAAANTVLLVVQVIGAVVYGSLALLADSVHQASDVVSLLMAVVIALIVAKPTSGRFTFGFGRADALGGLAHALILMAGAVLIVVEAISRFGDEVNVDGGGVVVLALIGVIVNAGSAKWLHGVGGHSLNMQGAVLHLVADTLGSVVVLVSGLVIMTTGADWVDPVASILVTLLIVFSAARLLSAAVRVLMDGVPAGVDLDELRSALLDDPLVTDAHHVHVRSLDGETLSLTAHVLINTDQLHDAQTVTKRLTAMLSDEGIGHVTLQAECHPCDEPGC